MCFFNSSSFEQLTDGDIGGTMGLKEGVEVLPSFGDPVNDLDEIIVPHVLVDLCLNEFSPEVSAQEPLYWFCMIGTQHPPANRHESLPSVSKIDKIH